MNADNLKSIPLFQDLGSDALSKLAAVTEEKSFADQEIIFNEGDDGDAVYFIIEGAVRIEKRIAADNDATKTLTIIGRGDFFGEMALFDGKPRSAATVALGATVVYRFARGTFRELMETDTTSATALLFAIINTCNQRIRNLNGKVVVFHEVGKAVGESSDLQTLLDVIAKQMANATSAESASILLKEEFNDRLAIRCHTGKSFSPEEKEMIAECKGILADTISKDNITLVTDHSSDESVNKLEATGLEATSMIVSPIRVENKLLGVIVLGHSQPNIFDLDDVSLCSSIGSQAGQAIINFRHKEDEDRRSRHGRQYVRF